MAARRETAKWLMARLKRPEGAAQCDRIVKKKGRAVTARHGIASSRECPFCWEFRVSMPREGGLSRC